MVSKDTFSTEGLTLTDAGRLALDLRMILDDLELELEAICQEAAERREGRIDIDDLGRLWVIVRCGQVLTRARED